MVWLCQGPRLACMEIGVSNTSCTHDRRSCRKGGGMKEQAAVP